MRGWILLGLITAVGCSSPTGSSTSSATGTSGTEGTTSAGSTGGTSTGSDASSTTTGGDSSAGSSSTASSTAASTSNSTSASSSSSGASSNSGSSSGGVGRPTPPCDPNTSTPLSDGGCVCDPHRCNAPGSCGFTTYCCAQYGSPCDVSDGGFCCGGVCGADGHCALCTTLNSSCNSVIDCCQGT